MKSLSMLILATLVGACSGNNDGAIEASGTIEGTDITLAAEVMGRVRAVRVDEGTRVRRGDTLVVLDSEEYEIQLRQASANQEALASAYRLALEGARREDIIQAEAAYRAAEADYRRMKDLLTSQTITQKQYDDVYARYVAAEQTYQKLLRGSRKEEIIAARARVVGAEAQVDLLRKKVRDCVIVSPAEATVTLRAIEPGEYVGVGSNVLRLTVLDRVKLTIYVGETELGRVRLGQAGGVRIDGAPDREFEARVVYVSPVAEFTPKNVQTKEERTKLVFAVRLEVDNPDGALKPGLPADATLRP